MGEIKMKDKIAENLKRIKDNVADACLRTKRDPGEVRLIAVTKTVDLNTIRLLLDLDQLDLGESRVQDLVQKQAIIKESLSRRLSLSHAPPDQQPVLPNWHMIGHLQRNKVKQLLPVAEMIHSVDSLRLAEEINTAAAKLGLNDKVKILLQVVEFF